MSHRTMSSETKEDARDEPCPNGICTGTFAIRDCDSAEIRHVMVFVNGMVAVFDQHGQQVPDMQGHIVHLLKNAARHIEQNRESINEARRLVDAAESEDGDAALH